MSLMMDFVWILMKLLIFYMKMKRDPVFLHQFDSFFILAFFSKKT